MLVVWLGTACLLACVLACAAPPATSPDAPRALSLGTWVESDLHCARSLCERWYALSIGEPGELRIDLYSRSPGALALVLLDAAGAVLARQESEEVGPQQLRQPVEPGAYRLGVRARDPGGERVEFELLAERLPAPDPVSTPAPEPVPGGGP